MEIKENNRRGISNHDVKNGFSDPTKVQEGRDRPRKDVMNRCRGKLSVRAVVKERRLDGCPSREKINNNKNLARVTTKSKSETQTVSNGCVSRGHEIRFLGASQCRRPRWVSRIEVKYSLEQCSMGKRLKIIELGKYNSAEELLIETRTTGSQWHVYYRGEDWRTSITRAAVHMGLEGMGMRTGHRGAYKWGPSQEWA